MMQLASVNVPGTCRMKRHTRDTDGSQGVLKTRWCRQCKRDLPEELFYPLKKSGWRVTKCDDCARTNMTKWARTSLNQFDPNKVREVSD
jgi:hypothetical protein